MKIQALEFPPGPIEIPLALNLCTSVCFVSRADGQTTVKRARGYVVVPTPLAAPPTDEQVGELLERAASIRELKQIVEGEGIIQKNILFTPSVLYILSRSGGVPSWGLLCADTSLVSKTMS